MNLNNLDLEEEYLKKIKKDINKQPLVSKTINIENEINNLDMNLNFQSKLVECKTDHKKLQIRKLRRDGNCFYRGFLFKLFELKVNLMNNDKDLPKIILLYDKINNIKDFLKKNFELQSFDIFLDFFIEKFNNINNYNDWETFMKNEQDTKVIILILRFITSNYIKIYKDNFREYFDNDIELNNFCIKEIENIDIDIDNIQIIALNKFWEIIQFKIYYLDNNEGAIRVINIPEDIETEFIFEFLYRPGHYDLIY